MEIKLPEIQAALNELKKDSRAMANAQVFTAVEHLDEMLDKLELKATSVAPDVAFDLQAHIRGFEKFVSLFPQIAQAYLKRSRSYGYSSRSRSPIGRWEKMRAPFDTANNSWS